LNILFYQWNAYNLSDTRWAFEQKGYAVTMLAEPIANPEEDADYTHRLAERLSVGNYDFVFSLNYFPVLAESCHQASLPYVCWNCDGSLLAMYHESVFYPTNVIFTFDYKNYKEFHALGVRNIYHLPLAVNTHRLEKQFFPASTDYPVSFVGNLYEKNTFQQIKDSLPDYLAGYLRGAINAQKLVSGGNMLELLLTDDIVAELEELSSYHKSEQSFAGIKQLFATTILGFQTASEERQENLAALATHLAPEYKVHLFTGSDKSDLPDVIFHPPVDYQREMPQIFRRSKINLNMTIPNITTGIPLRVWDILGCGGFLLSNFQPELYNYFDIGKQMDIFEDQGELLEKTDFYLRHDSLRRQMARAGMELVRQEHNYLARIEQMVQTLNTFDL
jgi:Uncharacterized protein conserved in bacteria